MVQDKMISEGKNRIIGLRQLYVIGLQAILLFLHAFFLPTDRGLANKFGLALAICTALIVFINSRNFKFSKPIWNLILIYIFIVELPDIVNNFFVDVSTNESLIMVFIIFELIGRLVLLSAICLMIKKLYKFFSRPQIFVDIVKITGLLTFTIIAMYSYTSLDSPKPLDSIFAHPLFTLFFFLDLLIVIGVIFTSMSVRVRIFSLSLLPGYLFFIFIIIIDILIITREVDSSLINQVMINIYYYLSFISLTICSILMRIFQTKNLRAINSNITSFNIGKSRTIFLYLGIVITLYFMKIITLFGLFSIAIITAMIQLLDISLQRVTVTTSAIESERIIKDKLEHMVKERTNELTEVNNQLWIELTVDSMTGLYNRKHFIRLLDDKIRVGKPFTLIILNINKFKNINDIYNHKIGDEILRVIGRRIRIISNNYEGIFARYGGDEFSMTSNSLDTATVKDFIVDISEKMSEKIAIQGFEYHPDLRSGIARFPNDGIDTVSLLKHADVSLSYSKQTNREPHDFDLDEEYQRLKRRHYIEYELRRIDYDRDLFIFYQPLINAKTEEIEGLEALIRWKHPQGGYISPAEFIPIAEGSEIIHSLTLWVFSNSMRQIKEWTQKYEVDMFLSVNVSAKSFHKASFLSDISKIIKDEGMQAERLKLEITEHSTIAGARSAEEFFKTISQLGTMLSIDDFGTGYSSYNKLRKFGINEIKIDKSFIDNIAEKEDDIAIVRSIVMMAKALGITTVAEGVETKQQVDRLRELDCDVLQGYYYDKPLPPLEFEEKYF